MNSHWRGMTGNVGTGEDRMAKIYQSRTSFLLDALACCPIQNGRKLLDVGFVGEYAEAAVHYRIVDCMGPSDHLVGIDISPDKIASFLRHEKTIQRQQKHSLTYETGSIYKTRFAENEFDVVFILEVMEHLFTPFVIFDEIRRILKPGGSLIITYPNPLSLIKMVDYLRVRNLLAPAYLSRFRGAPDHKIFPHPVCMAIYLNDIGFSTQAIDFMKYDLKYLTGLNELLARIGLTRRLASYVGIHAVKAE